MRNKNITLGEILSIKDKEAETLWMELEDIPFDETELGGLIIAQNWLHFEKGTEREEIWHWFDEKHSQGVHYLLNVFKG